MMDAFLQRGNDQDSMAVDVARIKEQQEELEKQQEKLENQQREHEEQRVRTEQVNKSCIRLLDFLASLCPCCRLVIVL